MEINRYGWLYRDTNDTVSGLNIIPPEDCKKATPDTLFKYYDLNDRSIQALENKYIYAPHPLQLNDPFDCSHRLIEFDDVDSIETFVLGKISRDEIEERLANPSDNFKNFIQYNFNQMIYARSGIISLTEEPLNILMWSYYSVHKGFCVEFDYKKFGFKFIGPFQINYQDKIEPMSIKAGGNLAFLFQTNVKTIVWKHESEWRILAEKEANPPMEMPGIKELEQFKGKDRTFCYDLENIKSIILGNSFFHINSEYERQSNGEMHVTLKDNLINRNKLIDFINNNKIKCEIIFRDEDYFCLNKKEVVFERLEENRLKISQVEFR